MLPASHSYKQIKKICVIGPECTGKSDLSKFLAEYYKTACVDEYARAYLDKLNRPYQKNDLVRIAHGQVRMEDEWLSEANRLLMCDTNTITIKVWSEYKYGDCDEEVSVLIKERVYDLYLLTYIDIPWEEDPQREHPDKREYFWNIFKSEVINTGVPFEEIRGLREERRKKAIETIDRLLQK